ncbi:MAG: hypothetical protein ACRCVN_06915 [Spirochaetia bacterium]
MYKTSIRLFITLCVIFGLFLGDFLISQEGQETSQQEMTVSDPNSQTEVPAGYRDYTFGLSIADVRKKLENDPQFFYKGEPDVTMMEPPDRTTIGVEGNHLLTNGFFLFHEDQLYGVILEMNTQGLDYFALYSQLNKKYGTPTTLNPQRALWETENVLMSLERALFIKYIDRGVFEQIKEKMDLQKNYEAKTREDFLSEL